jgi:Tfp pilus assembly protein PilV
MKNSSMDSSNGHCPGKGLTLIEVVASLVLIALTATSLLAAYGRSLEQLRATREQETADGLARELLAHWSVEPIPLDEESKGTFENEPGWQWSRNTQRQWGIVSLEVYELTLTIERRGDDGHWRRVATHSWLQEADSPKRMAP